MRYQHRYDDDEAHAEFQGFLSELRENRVREGSIADNLLKYFYSGRTRIPEDALRLFCTNEKADAYNKRKLEEQDGACVTLRPLKGGLSVQSFKRDVRVQIKQNVYDHLKLVAANGSMGVLRSLRDDGHELFGSSSLNVSIMDNTTISAVIGSRVITSLVGVHSV